jgi:hypothetical protein
MKKTNSALSTTILLPFVVCLAVASNSEAATRHGHVLATGEVIMSGGGSSMQSTRLSCGDGELLFRFTETVLPAGLDFRRLDAGTPDGTGNISVRVTIGEVCASSGQATFRYGHSAEVGSIGSDISIAPVSPVLTVALEPAATASADITYSIAPRTEDTGEQDKRFALRAAQLSFFAGDVFGQAGRSEVLAEIMISEAPPLKDDLISGDENDGGLGADARDAFNDACLDPSAEGSVFLEICRAAQDVEDEEVARRIVEAFDVHEVAALTAASSEGGRIQAHNIASRMAGLRQDGERVSLNGIALAYNGNLFDASWLPADISSVSADGGSGGGSTLLGERWGAFVNGDISLGDRDRRGKEAAFDFDSWGLTAGVDYRFVSGIIAGVALGYSRYEADLDRDGGSVESDTLTVQGYGTYNFSDDLYLDATLGYSNAEVDQQRVVDLTGLTGFGRTVARGTTDSTQLSASLALNYRLPIQRTWDATAYGQVYYADNEVDGFTEIGSPFAVNFPKQSFSTQTFTGGLRGTKAFSFSRGILVPFVDASYSYEGGNDGFVLSATLVETGALAPRVEISDPDRSFGRLDIGTSWVFLSGNQLFISYSLLLGESDTKLQSFNFGARFEF